MEAPNIRRLSLESLARLNWKPSNEERAEVYALFASKQGREAACTVMSRFTLEQFADLDQKVAGCASLINQQGDWTDFKLSRVLFDELRSADGVAVTISLCQQVLAHPDLQTRLVLLAIKLGISGSETELVGILDVYGDKTMAEDYLNSGSSILSQGASDWASRHNYKVSTGYGSHRSSWGEY